MIPLSLLSENNVHEILSKNEIEPQWMLSSRKAILSKFSGLPNEVSPLYSKYTGLTVLEPTKIYFSNENAYSISKDLEMRLEEIKSSPSILLIGSSVAHIFVPEALSKKGLIVSTIQDALKNNSELVKKYFLDNSINYEEDRFLALGSSAFQSGFFIYLPRNLMIEEPIRIVYSLKDDRTSSICRNIVIAEEGSKGTIVQELYSSFPTFSSSSSSSNHELSKSKNETQENDSSEKRQECYFEVLECIVKPAAELEFITLQAMNSDTFCVANRKAFVEKDAKMSWYSGMFGARLCRFKTDSVMKGSGARAEDVEIVFGTNKQSFDISSNLDHIGFSTKGKVLVKSIVKDAAKSLFKGMIKIRKDAQASESYLAGHAILLNKGAQADAIPGLEIETNEVKATHSASVSQIDEEQIFYLMCKGLDRESAKREIINGFVEPLSRKMGPFIRAWISYLFENKWTGKPLMLKGDEVMEQILEVEKSRYKETADIFEKHYKYR
ncbi:SufB/SufD family protein [Candidatus Nitrosocosmicus arcticus]|uniref:Putative FeS cluster assembly protein sufD n=1 Tax=Candidatus Nitrosocosmicus arcticus TaxID=2035267 RepID=A0A557SU43_9ARCH|nr:SufD family Fe-S cluster assembly protein [Candidatus Nitrosocosmicus arcticus]TVP40129.1 putative FeS cluster assembly protein sufD [Candidatus Nitrosocosmicus arcticus]